MDEDDLNKDHQHATNKWAKHFLDEYGDQGVEKLASSYREGQPCRWELRRNGSFNSCHKVVFEDGTAWAVRFPIPGRVMHPDEKIRREVAVMRFVKEKTKVPLPKVIAFGTAADNHDPSIGPFLITEWVEGIPVTSLIEELPRPSWGPVLRHEIEDNLLRKIYRQMAEEDDTLPSWSIDHRPMTMKMNDVEAGSNVIVDGMPALESSFPYANIRRSYASSVRNYHGLHATSCAAKHHSPA